MVLVAASSLLALASATCVRQGSPISSGRACHVPGTAFNHSSCCGEIAPPHECYNGCCLACNGPVMDPKSRCIVKNSSHSRCPPPPPPPVPPPPPRPCEPETLASGITLPCPWPPLLNMTRDTILPHYITTPPKAINIDDGRQLWVDDFLVDTQRTTGVEREYRQAEYRNDVNPIMAPTQPWEKRNYNYARAYSGGVWWIPEENIFKMWYGCGTSPATDSCIGLCLATSADGLRFEKKPLDVVTVLPSFDRV